MSRARPYRLTTLLLACVASSAIAGSSMQNDDDSIVVASLGLAGIDRASVDPFDIPAISGGFSRAEPVATGSVHIASAQPSELSGEPGRAASSAALTPADDFGPPAEIGNLDAILSGRASFGRPGPPAMLGNADAGALRTAIEFYRKGDLAGGDAAAARLSDPSARTLAEWIAIRTRPSALGFERITAFIEGHQDWPTKGMLRRRAEEALVGSNPGMRQLESFFAQKPPVTTAGKVALARLREAAGRKDEATALIRETWRRDDFGADLEGRILAAFPDRISALDHRLRAERLLFAEQWNAALRNAARAGDDVVKLAKARIAVDANNRKTQAALDAVPRSVQSDPSFAFSRAQYLRRKEKPVEAAKALAGITRDPALLADTEAWWTERRVLARKLLDMGEPRLAYQVAAEHPEDSGAVRIEGEFHAGWIALRFLKDSVTASRHFAAAAAIATTPISIARASYWQGRAADATQDPSSRQEADGYYERAAQHATAYYGQLARARLGYSGVTVRSVASEPTAPENLQPVERAIAMLYEADARDLAMPLVLDIAKTATDPERIDVLAELLTAKGDARTLLTLGKTASQRGLPVDDHAFPLIGIPAYTAPVAAVEKPLVFAIVRQENAFDPKAVSSAGARGLMQLMPATAKTTASRAGVSFELDRLTNDAGYNALLGASHLGDLVGEWRGSYLLTIAAYNAGSGNVKKWIEAYGDPRKSAVDPVDWVERIPFTETRNYVQRVMENLQVYRTRLDERSTLLIERDLRRGVLR